jgi:glycosyltransferase involved in cell wall biosynthesis
MPEQNRERISVVTVTFRRPGEVVELFKNLSEQSVLPFELILIDTAPNDVRETEQVVAEKIAGLPFPCHYIRAQGGTWRRNNGIDAAQGDFVAFIDDDIRLEPGYFEEVLSLFRKDQECRVGGVAGYILNQFLDADKSPRWRWYRRLKLFTTYEPGRYDFQSGYTINRYIQPLHDGVREIDWMGSNCAVWRKEVFEDGLRFNEFFRDFGVLEDAHLALRAGRKWKILESGKARCLHLRSPHGRVNSRRLAQKTAINYRFVFVDLVPQRTFNQEFRFWRVQLVDLVRFFAYAARTGGSDSWMAVVGKAEGIVTALRMHSSEPWRPKPTKVADVTG